MNKPIRAGTGAVRLVFAAALLPTTLAAQTPSEPAEPCTGSDCPPASETAPGAAADKPAAKPKSIAEFTKDKQRQDGLFPVYRDAVSGALFLELSRQQFDQSFIYYNIVRNGATGLIAQLGDLRFAGQVGENFSIRLRQRFNRVDIIRENLAYVIDADSPLRRAQGANAGDSVMGSMTIVARDEAADRLIVAAGPMFSGTDLLRLGNSAPILAMLGAAPSLNKAKSGITDVRTFPANTTIVTEYIFDFKTGPAPVTVELHHHLVAAPPAGFVARRADPRVGLFSIPRTNLTRTDASPIDDVIRRWRLEKRDPQAALSAPVKPITFWIQNSTPLEYRETIRRAALLWNPLFRAAGFDQALEIKVQPDDADWGAGDVRYNLIQWLASPTPLFNGYGPSVVDPRTGEIIAANIVLEHGSLRTQNRLLSALAPVEPTAAADHGDHDDSHSCELSAAMDSAMALATAQLRAGQDDLPSADAKAALDRLIHQRLTYLVMHEVGHTLGLTHNMKGSTFRSLDELRRGVALDEPITGSVMDYPAVLLLPDMPAAGQVFPAVPGPYDAWAIRFAYDPSLEAAATRAQLLALAGSPGYAFGIDAEDMRSTGRGIDPRVIPYDMSSDPVGFADAHMTLIRKVQADLPGRIGTGADALDQFVDTHTLLLALYRQQIVAVSRQIGGVHDERSRIINGDRSATAMVPVTPANQRRALALIDAALLAPGALPFSADYVANLTRTRRGQSPVRVADIDADIIAIQNLVLDHILHPETLKRLTSLAAMTPGWDGDVMLDQFSATLFDQDMRTAASPRRRALQQAYVGRLIAAVEAESGPLRPFRGSMLRQLQAVDKRLARAASRTDAATDGVRKLLRLDIRRTLETARLR